MNSLKTNKASNGIALKSALPGMLLAVAALAVTAPAKAADPCEQVLCLAGVMAGKGVVSGCANPVADYFDIVETSHGAFLPDHTSRKRKSQLDKCPAAGSDTIEKINDKFGRLRGL
ncbi:hypothetical protein LU196_14065 [Pantoea sp. Mb-10]|uniref:TrbM/KikA/MpfK family conjugal transfer protein n=1 Tax=unclassified Pantoea TaxID=2630326 RepID=UPI001E4CB614|nr:MULTISPECIES: TrbM/KikA/MpfK family conjugal transfer protein [unclassified Pantoea]MCE0491169.1 hypothetical protein [Pantoea sp. Mb-10]MCE0502658.1 hypothetical protein [Pantoea sp. Pb-8]